MNLAPRSLAFVAVAALLFTRPDPSEACGPYYPSIVFVRSSGPDAPLAAVLEGAVGLVDAGYRVDDLAIAYRHLIGLGLDAEERAAVIAERSRSPYAGDDRAAPWLSSRSRATVDGSVGHLEHGYTNEDYAFITNCNADAFSNAASTLNARIDLLGAGAPEVRRFVEAQDLVFRSCGRRPQGDVADAAGDASLRERNDRAYQRAAQAFYRGDYRDALDRFGRIANDPGSEWRFAARYVLARVHQRMSYDEGQKDSELRASLATLDAILADPAMTAWHDASRRYRDFVRGRLDPAARFREVSIAVASAHHGPRLATMLVDLRSLESPSSFESVRDDDRFGVFVEALRHPGEAEARRAAGLYQRTSSPAFLVATLAAMPTLASLPRATVDPMLAAATRLPSSHPGFVTALVHRARLLLGREGIDRSEMRRTLLSARAAIGDRRGPTAAHALTLLAFAYSDSIDDAVTTAGAAATTVQDFGMEWNELEPATDVATLGFDFHAYGKRLLDRLPLTDWVRLSRATALPADARAELATVAYARALLVADAPVRRTLTPIVAARFPAAAASIRAIEEARSEVDRRYARIWLLLHASNVRTELDEESSFSDGGFISTARYFCPEAPTSDSEGPLAEALATMLDRNETRLIRGGGEGSRAAIARLSPAGVWLAREAIAAVNDRPRDPRNPELLARAVRATRWACPGAGTRAASRDAFRLLHARYPESPEARRTEYFYGEP